MAGLIFFIGVFLLICFSLAWLVHKRLVRDGKNPWVWSIVTFLATAVALVVTSAAVINYMFRFER